MTLMLAARHPELWQAACDMFGPYDLFSFINRLPETWRTYFYLTMGHPDKDREFLTERSPETYMRARSLSHADHPGPQRPARARGRIP
jgi:dipeptidyl aminopeptidase/acylaminoacyl peptidase